MAANLQNQFPRTWNLSTLGFSRLVMGMQGRKSSEIGEIPDATARAESLMNLFRDCYPHEAVQLIMRHRHPLVQDLITSLVTEAIYQSNEIITS